MDSPRKSLTCPEKMIRAMPDVNPVTTGIGMNLMAVPSLATPSSTSITPAMKMATARPSIPNRYTMP